MDIRSKNDWDKVFTFSATVVFET